MDLPAEGPELGKIGKPGVKSGKIMQNPAQAVLDWREQC
jgi:hypothetical protein